MLLDFQFKSYKFLRSYGQSEAGRKDAFEITQLLQKKGVEQLEMMPQKRIPEAALSVYVYNLKYRSQGLLPKRWNTIVGKRTGYLLIYDD